jgi:hypothetical protein
MSTAPAVQPAVVDEKPPSVHEPPGEITAALAFAEASFPDGGREAWVQVVCCSVIFFFFVGGLFSWGVLQDALLQTGVANAALLSLVGALGPSLEVGLAIPASMFGTRYSLNRAAGLGSLLCGLSLILASFTTHNYGGLLVTQGIMFGCGSALCYNSCASLPSQYFLRRRGLTTGIVSAVGGCGAAVMALALSALVRTVGIPWAMRAFGITTLACCLPASYFLRARFTGAGAGKLDWRLFRDFQFVALFFAGTLANLAIYSTAYYIPNFARAIG